MPVAHRALPAAARRAGAQRWLNAEAQAAKIERQPPQDLDSLTGGSAEPARDPAALNGRQTCRQRKYRQLAGASDAAALDRAARAAAAADGCRLVTVLQ